MKNYILIISSILLVLTLVSCSKKSVNQDTNLSGSINIQNSESVNYDKYLKKEKVSLEDIEKIFDNEKIILSKQGQLETDLNRLQQKYPTEYYIDNDDKQVLRVYVFDTENERINAKSEYKEKTETKNMSHRKIYEVKNIMLFLITEDTSNQYYEKISLLAQKMQ